MSSDTQKEYVISGNRREVVTEGTTVNVHVKKLRKTKEVTFLEEAGETQVVTDEGIERKEGQKSVTKVRTIGWGVQLLSFGDLP